MLRKTGIKSIIRSKTIAYIRPQINVSLSVHTKFLHAFLFVWMDQRQNNHTHTDTRSLKQQAHSNSLSMFWVFRHIIELFNEKEHTFKAIQEGWEMVMFGCV